MPTISLTRVANSPRFAKTVMVTRSTGRFVYGQYKSTPQAPFACWGTLQPAKPNELDRVPEGDRKTGAMSFISETRLFETRTGGIGQESGLSDTIEFLGETYKVSVVDPWVDFGFFKAILTRTKGA